MTVENIPQGARYDVGHDWPPELLRAEGTVWFMPEGGEGSPLPREAEALRQNHSPHRISYVIIPDKPKSLRDEYAIAALTGLLAANATYGGRTDNRKALAADALAIADAMMEARK